MLTADDHGKAESDGTKAARALEPQRVILILTNSGSISYRMVDALEREFPRVLVVQVDHFDAACAAFAHPVALILIDQALLKTAEANYLRLLSVHPGALAAVIQPNGKCSAATFLDITASPLVRSILPMDLGLDIWLSVVRLMLCGGMYFPPEAMASLKDARSASPATAWKASSGLVRSRETRIDDLTARETQILAMASHGLQNKLIAVEFGLSEHTVKVHLHNIIKKLGVHNRTEAAARFRSALPDKHER